MWKLLEIFAISMFLVAISEVRSVYSYQQERYIYKERIFYFIMAAFMAAFVGLRTWYNDTVTYKMIYEGLEVTKPIFEGIDWSIGANPGFMFTNAIMRSMNISVQSFLMIYSVVTNGIYLWFLRKYSDKLWLTVFFFYTMGCYTFTMAAIKQCVAVAFCLIATDRVIKKKWISFILWTLLASTFHPYALMYLIMPGLTFSPWTRKTFGLLTIFGIVGVNLQLMLGTIVSITSMMGEEYDVSSFSGEGVNIFRFAVVCAPIVLSFLVSRQLSESKDRAKNLIVNLSMLNAEIMFIALWGTANYFARLANYFLIFQTLLLPMLFNYFDEKSKKFLIVVTIACYLLYFYYSNAINLPFDGQFGRMGLWEYMKQIF